MSRSSTRIYIDNSTSGGRSRSSTLGSGGLTWEAGVRTTTITESNGRKIHTSEEYARVDAYDGVGRRSSSSVYPIHGGADEYTRVGRGSSSFLRPIHEDSGDDSDSDSSCLLTRAGERCAHHPKPFPSGSRIKELTDDDVDELTSGLSRSRLSRPPAGISRISSRPSESGRPSSRPSASITHSSSRAIEHESYSSRSSASRPSNARVIEYSVEETRGSTRGSTRPSTRAIEYSVEESRGSSSRASTRPSSRAIEYEDFGSRRPSDIPTIEEPRISSSRASTRPSTRAIEYGDYNSRPSRAATESRVSRAPPSSSRYLEVPPMSSSRHSSRPSESRDRPSTSSRSSHRPSGSSSSSREIVVYDDHDEQSYGRSSRVSRRDSKGGKALVKY